MYYAKGNLSVGERQIADNFTHVESKTKLKFKERENWLVVTTREGVRGETGEGHQPLLVMIILYCIQMLNDNVA